MKFSNKQVTASKAMTYTLRHRPEEFGLRRAIEWRLKFDTANT